MPGKVKPAAFVAENVTPAAGARRLHLRVPAERDRTSSGDDDDPRLARRCPEQRNFGVVGEFVAVAGESILWRKLLCLQLPPLKPRQTDAKCAPSQIPNLPRDKPARRQSPTALRNLARPSAEADMVARAAASAADHLSRFIGEQRFGAGLAAVNSQIEAWHPSAYASTLSSE